MVALATAMGMMTEARPRIMRILRMLLPTMLPMVMSALPFSAAEMLTAASGALVPMATMVRPMTSWGIWNFRAMPAAPSTNQSAPLTRSTKPTARSKISRIMCISVSSFLISSKSETSLRETAKSRYFVIGRICRADRVMTALYPWTSHGSYSLSKLIILSPTCPVKGKADDYTVGL